MPKGNGDCRQAELFPPVNHVGNAVNAERQWRRRGSVIALKLANVWSGTR